MKKSAKFENLKSKKNEKKSIHRLDHFVDFFCHLLSDQYHRPNHPRPHYWFSFKPHHGFLVALCFFHCLWNYVNPSRNITGDLQRKKSDDVCLFTF